MGIYINRGNKGFESVLAGEYVDKSGLIAVVNASLGTESRFSCVSRSRRFGKSMAAKMLRAYYDHSCESRAMFANLEIAGHQSFDKHLNKYPVIFIDMAGLVSRFKNERIVETLSAKVLDDVLEAYPEVKINDDSDLIDSLMRIVNATGQQFIVIIDEWDAILREFDDNDSVKDRYVNWLRGMFKYDLAYDIFAGVYMTGILPIKKYNTQSALNNFREYSMVMPGAMAQYFGFTADEVRALAERHGMEYDELAKWYDGYQMGERLSMFNPNSVMLALGNRQCRNYWTQSAAYSGVAGLIDMNFDGLRDDVTAMLAGSRRTVRTSKFGNDMAVVRSRDEVLTLLLHLGYLSLDGDDRCYIPNREVAEEMVNAVEDNHWDNVTDALRASEQLLLDTLAGRADAVARGIRAVHSESTRILSYNSEESMACVMTLAYYYAQNDYVLHRELASGEGYADLVLLPRRHVTTPAIVIELKRDHTAHEAIAQIRSRGYLAKVQQHASRVLLVGIAYDSKTKQHDCVIEKNWE